MSCTSKILFNKYFYISAMFISATICNIANIMILTILVYWNIKNFVIEDICHQFSDFSTITISNVYVYHTAKKYY